MTVVVDLALSSRAAALQSLECAALQRQLEEAQRRAARGDSGAKGADAEALERRLSAARATLHSARLTWLKFAFDMGVALPSFYQQQTQREGLVQFMGCASALVATYKLVLAVAPK